MPTLQRPKPGRPRDESLTVRRETQILEAATAFFAENGYPNADLQVLADGLGVGKGTLYRYFASKEALFLATVDAGMKSLHAYIQSRTDAISDPISRLQTAITAFLEFFDNQPAVVELLIQERAEFRDRQEPTYLKHRRANIGPWEELLQGVIAQGRLRDVPVERITGVLSNMLYGMIFTHHFHRDGRTQAQKSTDIIDIAFNGLLTDAERTRLRAEPGGS